MNSTLTQSKSSHIFGFADLPITTINRDTLKVEKYAKGLAQFMEKCQTPMTIAIQGDWGTGKTSMMNLIRELIVSRNEDDSIRCIWFNTWQFSQFKMADDLPIVLLSSIVDEVVRSTEKGRKSDSANRRFLDLQKTLKMTMMIGLSAMGAGQLAQTISKEMESFMSEDRKGRIDIIREFRKIFQEEVNEMCGKNENSKIVFFIDDLDRLAPDKAVEVLEVIKIFLDCERCVFVLAIDYDVVSNGFKKKYGDSIDEEKGRKFFDKIIQVPFKMPVTDYKIEDYIREVLKKVGFNEDEVRDDWEMYQEIISHSIGLNPRGMMRLFNLFSLLQEVLRFEEENILEDQNNKKMLFSILCMQQAYEDCFGFFAKQRASLSEHSFEFFYQQLQKIRINDVDNDDQAEEEQELDDPVEDLDVSQLVEQLETNYTKEKLDSCVQFFQCFNGLLVGKDNKTEQLSGNSVTVRLNALKKLLGTSTVTTTDKTSVADKKLGKGIRYEYLHEKPEWYGLDEPHEKSNKPNGWNKCKVKRFKLNLGDLLEESEVKDFTDLMVKVIDILERRNPERFKTIIESPDKLAKLFRGRGPGRKNQEEELFASPKMLQCRIPIETKTNYNDKVKELRVLMERMGFEQNQLSIYMELAKSAERQ